MAFLTASDLRPYIMGLQASSDGRDTELTQAIASAEALCAAYLGYPTDPGVAGTPTAEDVTYTDYYDAEAIDGNVLRLDVYPVVSVTTAKIDSAGTWAYGTTISSSDYVVSKKDGRIYLTPTASDAWNGSQRGTQVVYVAGYETMPGWLKSAVILLVQHSINADKSRGAQSRSMQGKNLTFKDMPRRLADDVRELLNPHRLRSVLEAS